MMEVITGAPFKAFHSLQGSLSSGISASSLHHIYCVCHLLSSQDKSMYIKRHGIIKKEKKNLALIYIVY